MTIYSEAHSFIFPALDDSGFLGFSLRPLLPWYRRHRFDLIDPLVFSISLSVSLSDHSICGTTKTIHRTAHSTNRNPIFPIPCILTRFRQVSNSSNLHFIHFSLSIYPLLIFRFWPHIIALFDHESSSPTSEAFHDDPPDYVTHEEDLSDEDVGRYDTQQVHGYRRKNVYDSRVEQILYENLGLPILITDAGKNHEGGGSFIVYTIRTGVCSWQDGNNIHPKDIKKKKKKDGPFANNVTF